MSPLPVLRRIPSALLALGVVLGSLAPEASTQTGTGRVDVLNNRGEVTPLAGATIVEETLDEVRFTRQGSDRTESRPADRVVHVEYGRGSPAYESARESMEIGDHQNAVNLFSAAVSDKQPPWVSAHALLGLAEAHGARGEDAEAAEAAQRFLAEHPEHRLTPKALLLSARSSAAAGDAARAEQDVQRVLSLVSAGKLTPDWAARAHLEHGQILLDAGEPSAARAAFEAAERAATDGARNLGDRQDLEDDLAELALAARSGAGSAILATGDIAAARSFFQALERDGDEDTAIRVAALNGQAEADFLDEGRKKEAQLGFARVAVIGASVPEEHAKALYYLGRCCDVLGEEGREPNGRTRAQQYYKDVERRYPGTRWARLAQELIP